MSNSKLTYFIAGVIVAIVSSAFTYFLDARVAAQQSGIKKGSHVNLSAADYIEIMQLLSEYPRDVDPGSVRDASWMFTPDARSVIAGAPMIKPADFKNFYGSLVSSPNGQAKRAGNRHFNASYVIVGLPDGTARGSSYMMQVTVKEKGAKPEIDLMGKYEDLYVRTPDGWMMKERIWRGDTFVGSYQKVAPSPIISDPNTWKTENEQVIQQLLAQGNTRDETGEPLTPAGGPSMKRPASPIAPQSGVR